MEKAKINKICKQPNAHAYDNTKQVTNENHLKRYATKKQLPLMVCSQLETSCYNQ